MVERKETAAAPVPEVPVMPKSVESEEATFGYIGRFFPLPELAAQESGVDAEFGGFRPVLGRPDSVEGEQALLEVMRAFDRARPIPTNEVITYSAALLAEASFRGDPDGHALTQKLVSAMLRRQLDHFGTEDRLRFAAAVGRREFPDDQRLAALQTRWVCGAIDQGDERELHVELSRRGVGLHELVGGRVWVRGEPAAHVFDEIDSSSLARFLENRGFTSGPPAPPDATTL